MAITHDEDWCYTAQWSTTPLDQLRTIKSNRLPAPARRSVSLQNAQAFPQRGSTHPTSWNLQPYGQFSTVSPRINAFPYIRGFHALAVRHPDPLLSLRPLSPTLSRTQ